MWPIKCRMKYLNKNLDVLSSWKFIHHDSLWYRQHYTLTKTTKAFYSGIHGFKVKNINIYFHESSQRNVNINRSSVILILNYSSKKYYFNFRLGDLTCSIPFISIITYSLYVLIDIFIARVFKPVDSLKITFHMFKITKNENKICLKKVSNS